jgi:ABC-type uncharacterized transport system substrate-binding protein
MDIDEAALNAELKRQPEFNPGKTKEEMKRIFVLHSYHKEMTWLQDVTQGLLGGLREEGFEPGKNVKIKTLYMDTKRKTSLKWKKEIGRKAMEEIKEWKPHVVIATDDNAQIYTVSKMKDMPIPFVFLGVNADPKKYGYIDTMEKPGHNVTGAIERERFEKSVSLLKRLVPSVTRISIVCDDGPTGTPIIGRVRRKASDIGI